MECPEHLDARHDRKWTSEALFNILDNAVKYTPAGGQIRVSVEGWEMYVKIDIADTGIGISEQHLSLIHILPASIPVHFDSAGVANSFWPRNVVVFGVPVACVLLNLISGFTVSQKENAKPYMYYIMAVVAFVATGIMIYLGMK